MKHILLLVLFLTSFNLYSQIKIDDIGDNWKSKVDSALIVIKTYDPKKYDSLISNCKHITFWNGDFSTLEDKTTIMISQKDMRLNSINNIAAVIVHESFHMFRWRQCKEGDVVKEEILAYEYELSFLYKVPNVEQSLINHAKEMIEFYK